MILLEISALTKRFGGVVAVDGCSLSVADRSITGLIGPNGSGKTTVFNLVTGFIPRDSGEVRFKSRSIAGLGPDRIYGLGIGRTFQLARIFPRLTALENMLVPVRRAGLRAVLSHGQWRHERERAMEMLEFVEIARVAGTLGGALSYGQRKLLELAPASWARGARANRRSCASSAAWCVRGWARFDVEVAPSRDAARGASCRAASCRCPRGAACSRPGRSGTACAWAPTRFVVVLS